MIRHNIFVAVLTIILCAIPACATPHTEQQSGEPIQVMILGMTHFSGNDADPLNPDIPYFLGARGQKEIQDLLDRLALYEPDKIMVELDFEREDDFNQSYNAFLNDAHELTVNERQQVGMRLARRLGHDKLYAMDFDSFLDYRPAIAAAKELGQDHLLKTVEDLSAEIGAQYEAASTKPLTERLLALNATEQRQQRKIFLTIAQMGTAEDPQGALQVLTWWQRNLVMFARTAQRAKPGDKVLIVVGNGHREILQEFFGEAPGFRLVSPGPYLER